MHHAVRNARRTRRWERKADFTTSGRWCLSRYFGVGELPCRSHSSKGVAPVFWDRFPLPISTSDSRICLLTIGLPSRVSDPDAMLVFPLFNEWSD
jgi:hypothetical protein